MKFSLIKMIFRRYRKIMFSMAMIAVLASSMMNGMYNAWQSMDVSIKKYLSEYGIADAVITTDITDTDMAEVIRRTPGVKKVSARLSGSGQLLTESGEALTAQIISIDKDDILQQHHWEDLADFCGDYLLVDYWFAKQIGISVGDTLRIRTGEDEYRPFTAAGIVSAPETLERTKLDFVGKTYPDFGFVYAPISLLDRETEKESLRMQTEWQEQEAEYRKAEKELQDAWEEGMAELAEAREELERQESAFAEKRDELKEQIRQLTEGRIQLTQGRKELDDAEKTAEERKDQLEQMLERTTGQLLELEDQMMDLKEARNDLSSLLVRLEDARGQLGVARDQITKASGQLQTAMNVMKNARSLWERVHTAGEKIDLPEYMGMTPAEIEQMLANQGITLEGLNGRISQAEDGLAQLKAGEDLIQSGIVRINQSYLPEIQMYLEETEQGVETLSKTHEALQNGIAELEAGRKAIADFEREAPENRELIDQKLQEVKEGIRAIYSGLEEGEAALAEGREQLKEKTAEAETAHAEAESELEEGAKRLQEAWDEIMGWEGYTPLRNEFLIWFEPEITDRRATLKAIEKSLDVTVKSSELYDDSKIKGAIDGTVGPMWELSVVTPIVFTGIVMMVLFLFLSIMIRQSRQHIGILRALGFSRGEIRRSFSLICLMMMAVSSATGGALSVAMTKLLNDVFNSFFLLPEYLFEFNWGVLALSSAGLMLVSVAAVWLSAGSLNRIQPAEAISRAVAAPPKIGSMMQKLLRRMEPLSKFCLLSLKRTPFRFFSSVICLGGAVSCIFASFAFLKSKDQVVIQSFDHQMVYDGQIIFTGEPEEGLDKALRGLDAVQAAERYWGREDEIGFGGKIFRTLLIFLEPETEMVSLNDPAGNPISYPSEGVMLSAKCANQLGVKVGDRVTIGEAEIPVTGISRQMGMDFAYFPAKERTLFHSTFQTGWMIRLREESNRAEVVSLMNGKEGYVTTLWKSLMRKGYTDVMATYDLYMALFVGLCCAMGILIVVNTGRNNLNEQKLPLSVLRAMGFQHRQIARRWFLQSFLFFLFSLAIGFPGGRFAAIYCLDRMKMSDRAMEYIPSAYQYLWTAGLLFAFLVIGHLMTVRVMKKWDLVENTKGRE